MASRLKFATGDPEKALPVLGEFFPDARMKNPHGDFAFELMSAESDLFSVVHYHLHSPSSSSSVDTAGTLTLGLVETGAVDLGTSRNTLDTTAPWLFPQEAVRGDWDDVTITALTIAIPAAVQFSRSLIGDERFRLRFSGNAPISAERARQWASLVRYFRQAVSEDSPMVTSELVASSAFSHLIATLLATFPNNTMEAKALNSPERALPSTLRRAIEYMESNAHRPIGIEDIAREARLSIRGLQYAFRTSLDTTPTAYLRRIRLAGAHRSLQMASPEGGSTVATIALEWGFAHPGRFAAQYRSAYGVTPRRTLDR
jgi:AraC-like DNA-binding protein